LTTGKPYTLPAFILGMPMKKCAPTERSPL